MEQRCYQQGGRDINRLANPWVCKYKFRPGLGDDFACLRRSFRICRTLRWPCGVAYVRCILPRVDCSWHAGDTMGCSYRVPRKHTCGLGPCRNACVYGETSLRMHVFVDVSPSLERLKTQGCIATLFENRMRILSCAMHARVRRNTIVKTP